ncbi:MAG: hypothetical protein JNM14_02050 [Ferruginibacter sp.]|nr:hypothetical protein [Ferruginibacter sp.]
MKKYIAFIIALTLFSSTGLLAQNRNLKQVMELKMPKTVDDDMPGTRGAGVCWNPLTKKYYAAFCGNMGYPMAVFDVAGKRLSDDDLTTMQDIRGIWYNTTANRIMANTYSNLGWISYDLDPKGMPKDFKTKYEGMNQPTEQCVGSYDNKLKQVFFLKGSRVIRYSEGSAKANPVAVDSVQIHWGRKKVDGAGEDEDAEVSNEDYNYTNVIATNIPGSEIAVLNTNLYQVELYNIKDGFLRQTLKLPETAKAEPSFNFAYSNGIWWLFDMERRTWVGCK